MFSHSLQHMNDFTELLMILEFLINRGKSNVSHRVDTQEALHDHTPDFDGAHFGFELVHQLPLDFIDHAIQQVDGNRAFAASNLESLENFFAAERLPAAVFLDHHNAALFDLLEG